MELGKKWQHATDTSTAVRVECAIGNEQPPVGDARRKPLTSV